MINIWLGSYKFHHIWWKTPYENFKMVLRFRKYIFGCTIFTLKHVLSETRPNFFSQNIFQRSISAFILYLCKLNSYINETYIRFIKNRSNICFQNKSKNILPETFVLFHWLLFMFAPLKPLPHLSIKDTPNVSFTIFFLQFFYVYSVSSLNVVVSSLRYCCVHVRCMVKMVN